MELYGVVILLPIRGMLLPVKVPGWVNFGILKYGVGYVVA